ncbi:DUF4336 domain-containing protein [Pseudoalteromonas sp. S16_S37]|uniref:DUF4336 domain-containing protein n=1 Tax=Pseudoalteromonas sp. S16_S37 TaxID=2720228 RepID=UPI001680101C|nr:DUF4336 domain-containing protein [Pseudoalteromonas sp. S16_S37]MBD1584186.1 DUF4336 domain-containing protein [Pseudoalteromonas sp. S16_S37]
MKKIADNIWIFDGEAVSYFSLPYTTRMTVVRFADQSLWVHSPIKLDVHVLSNIKSLGEVKYLIAPNELHHLYVKDWQLQFPQATTLGTAEVIKKRSDLTFDDTLTEQFSPPWPDDITQLLFTGSPAMEEAVFFHRPSHTLIVTDLIENFSENAFEPPKSWLAKFAGIIAPNGKTPLDWRLSFSFHKDLAREHVENMIAWQPKTIIMSHGEIVYKDAVKFLYRSFDWLHPKEIRTEQHY